MSERMPVTAHVCMTKDIGVGGNLFGGVMLAWMDEAAALYARQVSGVRRVVTLKYAEILFRHPVRVGDLVQFHGLGPVLGRSSIQFEIEAEVAGQVVFQTTATFVAVDDRGRPTPIPR